MPKRRSKVSRNPEIELTAGVKARELRFEKVPETKVEFHGHPERASVSGTERENLPESVERDVDYRDAEVRLRIASEVARKGRKKN